MEWMLQQVWKKNVKKHESLGSSTRDLSPKSLKMTLGICQMNIQFLLEIFRPIYDHDHNVYVAFHKHLDV